MYEPSASSGAALAALWGGNDRNRDAVAIEMRSRFTTLTLTIEVFRLLNYLRGLTLNYFDKPRKMRVALTRGFSIFDVPTSPYFE